MYMNYEQQKLLVSNNRTYLTCLFSAIAISMTMFELIDVMVYKVLSLKYAALLALIISDQWYMKIKFLTRNQLRLKFELTFPLLIKRVCLFLFCVMSIQFIRVLHFS